MSINEVQQLQSAIKTIGDDLAQKKNLKAADDSTINFSAFEGLTSDELKNEINQLEAKGKLDGAFDTCQGSDVFVDALYQTYDTNNDGTFSKVEVQKMSENEENSKSDTTSQKEKSSTYCPNSSTEFQNFVAQIMARVFQILNSANSSYADAYIAPQSSGSNTSAKHSISTSNYGYTNESSADNTEVNSTSNTESVKTTNVNVNSTSSNIDKDKFVQTFNAACAKKGGKSVLEGKGSEIYEIAEKNGIDPALFASIICLETGYGTSNMILNKNNPGGIKGKDGNFRSYNSLEEGLDSMAGLLKNKYIDKGLTTIDAIGNKYCPGSQNWKNIVSELYNKFSA